jgi:2-dehydropantoate 2-reductase
MRFVVVGAGAIGSIVGGHLARTGHDVLLVGRPAHVEAINNNGLRIWRPERTYVVQVPAIDEVDRIGFREDDVVLLCVKGQDTEAALDQIERAGGTDVPLFCCQNGVVNEEVAARRFPNVYGVVVNVPGQFHEPGTVYNPSRNFAGNLGVGRYPDGLDDCAREVQAAFARATFKGGVWANVMAYKWRKYLGNLANSVGAITDNRDIDNKVATVLRDEAQAVIDAAGIEVVSPAQKERDMGLVGREMARPPLAKTGGSSWQSLLRRTGSIETGPLNGYIAELGARHGVPAPANARITEIAEEMAAKREPPGKYSADELLALLTA